MLTFKKTSWGIPGSKMSLGFVAHRYTEALPKYPTTEATFVAQSKLRLTVYPSSL